jgi:hypothetical protein
MRLWLGKLVFLLERGYGYGSGDGYGYGDGYGSDKKIKPTSWLVVDDGIT